MPKRKLLQSCSKRYRRKLVQEENDLLEAIFDITNDCHSNNSHFATDNFVSAENNEESFRTNENIVYCDAQRSLVCNNTNSSKFDSSISSSVVSLLSQVNDQACCVNELDHNSNTEEKNVDFKVFLTEWTIMHNISHIALSHLLCGLRTAHAVFKDLPKCAKTFLHTPKSSVITNIGIDGLPISRSNTNQLWPILGRIIPNRKVFLIGCYFGKTKPDDSGASNKDRNEEDSINNSSHTYQLQRRNSSTWNHQSSSPIILNQLKKLTREVTVIKYDIRQALTSIDILVQKANEETRYRITDNSLEEVENLFPLKTTIALIEMEETLSNKDSELAKKITAYIRSIGGGNVDDAVKRCLRKTFTNELAQMYNWEGRCGKNALQNLHLIKVIFRCILQNIIGSDHKQIQKRIMEWFRHSKARHSNEEKRQRRNQNDDGTI